MIFKGRSAAARDQIRPLNLIWAAARVIQGCVVARGNAFWGILLLALRGGILFR